MALAVVQFAQAEVPITDSPAASKPAASDSCNNKSTSRSVINDVAPFVAEYDVETNALPLSASGTRSLRHLGDGRYRMEQVAKSFLLSLREVSEFWMKNCMITPKSYRYEQSGVGRDRRYLLDFNKQNTSVNYEADKQTSTIGLNAEHIYYDRLSETLALQCALQKQHQTGDHEEIIKLFIVDKGTPREHLFKVIGEEVLRVDKTDIKTLKVERVRGNDKRSTTLWLAPSQNFNLVKMIQDNDGKTIEFELKSIKQVF